MGAAIEASPHIEAPPARRRGRRMLWRITRIALLVYLGVCLVISMLQTSMIFPGAASQGQPYAVVRPDPSRELLELKTPGGETVAAVFGRALTIDGTPRDDASTRPSILFFYGNGMCMADALGEFGTLRRLGNNVVLCDYLGYGMSSGKPSGAGCYAAAEAVWAHVTGRPDVDKTKIIPFGWSLGSGVAFELASTRPVAGLITCSAFTSMADMARAVLPLFPTSLLLRHHFENERKLERVKAPMLIMHGTHDSIIPFSMSERLAMRAGERATFLPIDGGDHNDVFDAGGEEMFKQIAQFIDRATGSQR